MCYTVPLAGAVVSTFAWRKTRSTKAWWLTLMFYGGALFGVIDHLWNGELFLISGNTAKDLLLGVAITAAILVSWGMAVMYGRKNPALAGNAR